jgi:hypothetical protein
MNADDDDVEESYRRNRAANLAGPSAAAAVDAALTKVARSKLRLLTVACRNCQGTLLEVFPSPSGPLARGSRSELLSYPDTPSGVFFARRRSGGRRRRVDALLDGRPDDWTVRVACKCSESSIPGEWLADKLATGKRRVVWPDSR